MKNFLINSNLDVYYYLSLLPSEVTNPVINTDKVNEFERNLLKEFMISQEPVDKDQEFYQRLDDNHLILKDTKLSLNQYGSHPLKSVGVGYLVGRSPSLSEKVVNYEYLKSILNREGTLYLSEYLEVNHIGYYKIPKASYGNEILLDSNPFEFLLIQLGLGRIDEVEFEPDYLNKESNTDCWKRYQTKRIRIYEYDFLSRRWR